MLSRKIVWFVISFFVLSLAVPAQRSISDRTLHLEILLREKGLLTAISEAEKGANTDIESLFSLIELYSRAANGPKMTSALNQIVTTAESSKNSAQTLSRAVPYAKDRLVTDTRILVRFLNLHFDSDVFGKLLTICESDRTSCDVNVIDKWIREKVDSAPETVADFPYMDQNSRWAWVERQVNWRKRIGGDVRGITAKFADDVRKDPANLNAALRFVRFAQNSQEMTWLAETFSGENAFDYFELGSRLARISAGQCCPEFPPGERDLINQVGAKLLLKSLATPFGAKDTELMGRYRLSRASMPPKIGDFEKQLRYWTKQELVEVYLKTGRAHEAQPIVEELSNMDTRDILAGSVYGFAGASQMGSGARAVESKILAEQATRQDSYHYWNQRIEYYRGRKEPVQVFDAYLQALKVVPVDLREERSSEGRLSFIRNFAEFATDSEFGMGSIELANLDSMRERFRKDAEGFLSDEFERTKGVYKYAYELLGIIQEEDFDDLSDRLLPEYPQIILGVARLGSISSFDGVVPAYFGSAAIDRANKDRLFAELLMVAGKKDVHEAWALCDLLMGLEQPHQASRVIGILTKNHLVARGRSGRVGDGEISWSDVTEKYSEVLFDAYIRTNDWRSGEKFFYANPSWRYYSPYERLALAAARSGSTEDAFRLWKITADLNRRNLDYLASLKRFPDLAIKLKAFYRQMKVDEPYSTVPDLALKELN